MQGAHFAVEAAGRPQTDAALHDSFAQTGAAWHDTISHGSAHLAIDPSDCPCAVVRRLSALAFWPLRLPRGLSEALAKALA